MRYKVTIRQSKKYTEEVEFILDDFQALADLVSLTLYNCESSSIKIEKYVEETKESEETES